MSDVFEQFMSIPNRDKVIAIKMKTSYFRKILSKSPINSIKSNFQGPQAYNFMGWPVYLDETIQGDYEVVYDEITF